MNRESAVTEPVLWSAFPSWRQFSWLYLISALVAWRAWLFRRFELPGWEAWLLGAMVLVGSAALLRRWARYELTPVRLVVRNGYTGRVISQCPLEQVDRIELRQGPVAGLLGLGTLVIKKSGGETVMRFRGLSDPQESLERIEKAKGSIRPRTAAGW